MNWIETNKITSSTFQNSKNESTRIAVLSSLNSHPSLLHNRHCVLCILRETEHDSGLGFIIHPGLVKLLTTLGLSFPPWNRAVNNDNARSLQISTIPPQVSPSNVSRLLVG